MYLVSVVIPVYNTEKFLKETLDSVLAQSYSNLEILIIDNASTDSSPQIIQYYSTLDNRIKVHTLVTNLGASGARNKGMELSTGDFIAFLDADDIWYRDKVLLQLNKFLDCQSNIRRKPLGLVYGTYEYISEDSSSWNQFYVPTKRGYLFKDMLKADLIKAGSTIFISRKVLEKVGYFDLSLRWLEDRDFTLRIAKEFEFEFVEEPICKYRQHPNGQSKNWVKHLEYYLIISRRYESLNPDIPKQFFIDADSDYILWLADMYKVDRNYLGAFNMVISALRLNPKLILEFRLYRQLWRIFKTFINNKLFKGEL